jgi:hypothetical protein
MGDDHSDVSAPMTCFFVGLRARSSEQPIDAFAFRFDLYDLQFMRVLVVTRGAAFAPASPSTGAV